MTPFRHHFWLCWWVESVSSMSPRHPPQISVTEYIITLTQSPLSELSVPPGRHNLGFLAEALKGYGRGDVWRMRLQQTTASSLAPNPLLDPKQCLRCSHIWGDEPSRPSGLKNILSSSDEARIQEMWKGCGCDTMCKAAATPVEYQRAGHAFILYSAHIHTTESDPVSQFSTLTNNSLLLDCPHTERIHF